MSVVPHKAQKESNIPIPLGIKDKVIKILKERIAAEAYKPSQSFYHSCWFCGVKKNGDLQIVHDLQPLNRVSIQHTNSPPIIDDLVKPFAGYQCYTVFNLRIQCVACPSTKSRSGGRLV